MKRSNSLLKPQKMVTKLPISQHKQGSLPQLGQIHKLKMQRLQKYQKRQEENLVNLKRKLQELSNKVQRKKSINAIYNERMRRDDTEQNITKRNKIILKNTKINKQNTAMTARQLQSSRNSIKLKTTTKDSIQHSIKKLFETIQTKLTASQSIESVSSKIVEKKLDNYHNRYSKYLSLCDINGNTENRSSVVSPTKSIFQHKQIANKCIISMIANIGYEIKKLEDIDARNSKIINQYVDGQFGILQLKKYYNVLKNKCKD